MKIIDVGANPINTPAYQPLIEEDMCRVWGFEPHPDAFASLQKVRNTKLTYFPVAIGQPGTRKLYAHEFAVLSSSFRIHKPSADFLGRERWYKKKITEIETEYVSLDSLSELPAVDVLKMDLQGGELDVVLGGKRVLSEAVAVIPEVRFHRIYNGEPLWAELDIVLRKHGFKLHKFLTKKSLPIKNSQWRRLDRKSIASQLLDGDAVYIRDLEDKKSLSCNQLKQLVVAADVIFKSFDLALHCLDELTAREEISRDITSQYVEYLPKSVVLDN